MRRWNGRVAWLTVRCHRPKGRIKTWECDDVMLWTKYVHMWMEEVSVVVCCTVKQVGRGFDAKALAQILHNSLTAAPTSFPNFHPISPARRVQRWQSRYRMGCLPYSATPKGVGTIVLATSFHAHRSTAASLQLREELASSSVYAPLRALHSSSLRSNPTQPSIYEMGSCLWQGSTPPSLPLAPDNVGNVQQLECKIHDEQLLQ